MKDFWKELIGFTIGLWLSIQLLPQILKAIKTKKTMDLSYLFLMTSILGSLIVIIYGFFFFNKFIFYYSNYNDIISIKNYINIT